MRYCLIFLAIALSLIAPLESVRAADAKLIKEGRRAAKVCKACHHFIREKRKFGPHLVKLINRPVASADKFRYSDALKAVGGVWTEERLAAFLYNPQSFAPGTNMKFKGYRNKAKSKAAAAYFGHLTAK
ncbi:MAG: c-type cytochrome [Alphaproteobacteria bacterium]|jgi:cytochrome c